MRRHLARQRGATLVELMVGIAMAAILLITVASVEVSSWKYRRVDEQAFTGQAEATNLMDRLAQDVRQATALSLSADGANSVTLTVAGGPVTYRFDPAVTQVLRQDRPLLRSAAGLQFYREDGGRTLRAVVTTTDGFRLESRATTRLGR